MHIQRCAYQRSHGNPEYDQISDQVLFFHSRCLHTGYHVSASVHVGELIQGRIQAQRGKDQCGQRNPEDDQFLTKELFHHAAPPQAPAG